MTSPQIVTDLDQEAGVVSRVKEEREAAPLCFLGIRVKKLRNRG